MSKELGSNFQVHVLVRCNKKSGKIDTVMTGMGRALLDLWAMQNTTSSKACFVINRESGEISYATYGTKEGFPKIKDSKRLGKPIGTCEDLGISYEALQEMGYDDRFDKEEE